MNEIESKKTLGQFYTTNYKYILTDFYIPEKVINIIEPFAGNCDLLSFINSYKEKNDYIIELFDIDPKKENVVKRDTLLNPPEYKNKFIITNPPYLARNKSKNKNLYDKYNTNDLYKCFIWEIIKNKPDGGIIIIPLNFLCSVRKQDISLRKYFFKTFNTIKINIFEERVFEDTSYTVCSIQFELNQEVNDTRNQTIKATIFPSQKHIFFDLSEFNNYTIGGELYKLPQNKNILIDRATSRNKEDHECLTNILLKAIDDNIESQLCLKISEQFYIDETVNQTGRSYATLIIKPQITLEKQKDIVEKFNKFIKEQREIYNSLFLTNYRESNTICRKRISFKLCYQIINFIMNSE